jgi:microcystin degradation protein MlrC
MGTSVLVVTDDEPDLARSLADEFAEHLRLRRQSFVGNLVSVEAAVLKAPSARGPVCLLDMGDNIGGGSPGDGTTLLAALIKAGVKRTFACLSDPASVEQAVKAGIGKTFEGKFGGKTDTLHGAPVTAKAKVISIFDGKFTESEARHGGRTEYDMGPTAVVELASGQTVMLTSRRIAPFSLAQLTSCKIDPAKFQVLVAKGVHAPVAAYAPVCPTLLRVNTPGVTTADMTTLEYHNRRKPLFPFEQL